MNHPTPPAAASVPGDAFPDSFPATYPYVNRILNIMQNRPRDDGIALVLIEYAKEAARTLDAQPSGVACTCPSGDGSLRWPCPQHPAPPIAQQGGGEVSGVLGEISRMDAIVEAYNAWPSDIRKKLSLHDLRRMTGWTPPRAALASKADGGRFLTNDQVQAIKDAAYRDGYERRHLEVLGALV